MRVLPEVFVIIVLTAAAPACGAAVAQAALRPDAAELAAEYCGAAHLLRRDGRAIRCASALLDQPTTLETAIARS